MAAMAALTLAGAVLASSAVVRGNALDDLERTLRENLQQVSMDSGSFQAGEDLRYYQDGVYTLVYSQSQALLAGQVPAGFPTTGQPFENGVIRTVEEGGQTYYLMDLFYPHGWEDGVWLRGVMEAPRAGRTVNSLLTLGAVVLPAFILLCALGGFWIARRAFRRLDQIIDTAAAIGEGADLTARVEVPRGNREFARLGAAFNQMVERLEAAFEAEKRFTADASHELRTPVAVISGACEYAEKFDETPEERSETMAIIRRQTDRMSALITQLLSMTRLDQGVGEEELEPVDLGALACTVCAETPCQPGRLACAAGPGLWVRGNPPLLARLLQNLIDNALKYSPPDSPVEVGGGREGETVLLWVQDRGPGIPPEHRERIWDRFYQVDPSRAGAGGAGLGLSMVRRIAQLHGGDVRLESVPGLGSRFTLALEAVRPPEEK